MFQPRDAFATGSKQGAGNTIADPAETPALAGGFFTTEPPGKPRVCLRRIQFGAWIFKKSTFGVNL